MVLHLVKSSSNCLCGFQHAIDAKLREISHRTDDRSEMSEELLSFLEGSFEIMFVEVIECSGLHPMKLYNRNGHTRTEHFYYGVFEDDESGNFVYVDIAVEDVGKETAYDLFFQF